MTDPVLRIRSLSKEFRGRRVVRGFDLDVHDGETICVIGPSGSGKSTMLRCINGLETPSEGEILVDGVRVPRKGRELDELRIKLGIVFQQFNLFPHMSIKKNVMFGLMHGKKVTKAEAARIALDRLDAVGLLHLAPQRPAQLSGGEKQRVAIARALAMDPTVMLFDEPTSSLDPELVKSVLQLMKSLSDQNMTMLIVTHEMKFAEQAADRVLFMDHGCLIEQGTPDQIFNRPQSPRLQAFLSQVL